MLLRPSFQNIVKVGLYVKDESCISKIQNLYALTRRVKNFVYRKNKLGLSCAKLRECLNFSGLDKIHVYFD